jgi:hypothetical protein
MGKLDDYSLDQVAGALALIISSVGVLMLICFKSRCSQIRLCWGLWSCVRVIPEIDSDGDGEPEPQPEPETPRP